MCECYDPNGPRYCNIHKETTNSNKNINSYGLESMLAEFDNKDNKNYNK